MESWISGLALHGYSILFAVVFLEAIGFPLPAALALHLAGGARARGSLQSSYALSPAQTVRYLREKEEPVAEGPSFGQSNRQAEKKL